MPKTRAGGDALPCAACPAAAALPAHDSRKSTESAPRREGTLPESIRAEKEQKVTQGEACGRNRPAQQGFQMGKGKIMGRTAADPDHHARPMQQVQFGTCIVGRHGSAFCQLPQGKMSHPLLSSLRGKGKRRLRNGFQDSCRAPAFFHGSSFQEYSCFYRI